MYQSRIQKIRQLLIDKQLDATIISSTSNIFYLTGISHFSKEEREAYVLITKKHAYFFTTSLYLEEVQKSTSGFVYHQIGRDQPFVKILKTICEQENIERAGFEEHDIRYSEYHWVSKVIKHLSPFSLEIRIEKDNNEIENIKKACKIGDKAFAYAVQQLKEGISEKEIAVEIELFLRKNNSDISFRPIVTFGTNSSMPHHEANDQRLKNGDAVLIDMGAKVNGYCSDMTRTLFFGQPTDEAKKIYQIVLESQKRTIEYISGHLDGARHHPPSSALLAKDVDRIAREYILSQGYPSIPHSLGHGIGIDVHEPPRLSPLSETELTEDMVFSIEPGIYIPDFMGVRIEDLFSIENGKLNILTLSPKELFVL